MTTFTNTATATFTEYEANRDHGCDSCGRNIAPGKQAVAARENGWRYNYHRYCARLQYGIA